MSTSVNTLPAHGKSIPQSRRLSLYEIEYNGRIAFSTLNRAEGSAFYHAVKKVHPDAEMFLRAAVVGEMPRETACRVYLLDPAGESSTELVYEAEKLEYAEAFVRQWLKEPLGLTPAIATEAIDPIGPPQIGPIKCPTIAPDSENVAREETAGETETLHSVVYVESHGDDSFPRAVVRNPEEAASAVRKDSMLHENDRLETRVVEAKFTGERRFVLIEIGINECMFTPTDVFDLPPVCHLGGGSLSINNYLTDDEYGTREKVLREAAERNAEALKELAEWDGDHNNEPNDSWWVPIEVSEPFTSANCDGSFLNGVGMVELSQHHAIRVLVPTIDEWEDLGLSDGKIPAYVRRYDLRIVETLPEFEPKWWWQMPEQKKRGETVEEFEDVSAIAAMRRTREYNEDKYARKASYWMVPVLVDPAGDTEDDHEETVEETEHAPESAVLSPDSCEAAV